MISAPIPFMRSEINIASILNAPKPFRGNEAQSGYQAGKIKI